MYCKIQTGMKCSMRTKAETHDQKKREGQASDKALRSHLSRF